MKAKAYREMMNRDYYDPAIEEVMAARAAEREAAKSEKEKAAEAIVGAAAYRAYMNGGE